MKKLAALIAILVLQLTSCAALVEIPDISGIPYD